MHLAEGVQAVEKTGDPGATGGGGEQRCGEGEREERGQGGCAHSGEIAQSACEAAVADRLRGVQVAAKVAVFKGKVCGDKHFAARWRAQDRAVVAYAEGYRLVWAAGGATASNLLDQGELSHWLRSFSHPEGRIYVLRYHQFVLSADNVI